MPVDAQEISSLRARAAPVVILTGAGISRESGLHTFRDPDGIWATVRLEDVATPEAFAEDPGRVHAFYNARRRALLDPQIAPNPAHHALARLEHAWPGPVVVVTQNIDDLHERAGTWSDALIHMHGELLKMRCARCGDIAPVKGDLTVDRTCPGCGLAGGLRPHVVWFGEMPLAMDRIHTALAEAQLFVAVGTSGNVWPAAGFVREVPADCLTVELNLEPSEGTARFRRAAHGPAGKLVPALVDRLCPR